MTRIANELYIFFFIKNKLLRKGQEGIDKSKITKVGDVRALLFPERIIICPKGMTIITWGVGQVIVSVGENLRPNLI